MRVWGRAGIPLRPHHRSAAAAGRRG
jgi:hypothetical protein